MAIAFSHPCLALGGASLCTPLEACYSFATVARHLPSALILVYLVIPPCSLMSVLGCLFILLGVLCMLVCPVCCTGQGWVYCLPNAFVRFMLGYSHTCVH